MSTENNQNSIDQIVAEIEGLDIAGYLKQEVKSLFKNLHFYKLQNVVQNIDALKEYMLFLDNHSTEQIHRLEYEHSKEREPHQDVLYYVSKKGLEKVGEHKIHQKIWENDYNLNYVMQGIKGFLLLTADEFCNASPTRMSINRMLWQKQTEKSYQQKIVEEDDGIG